MKKFLAVLLWAVLAMNGIRAQIAPSGGGAAQFKHTECLSEAERTIVQSHIEENVFELRQKGILPEAPSESIVYFSWPLKLKTGVTDPSYYGISNFVDQNSGAGLLDYYCGNRTYNGHKGTDVFLWPFPWTKMDNNDVEVIAAASGVIVAKYDGNYDRQCNWVDGAQGNGIILQHADGSRSWYWHFKKQTLTSKSVGASVVAGEYLGVVGSSGISTGPHLHFEVYNSANQLIDPWSGSCNTLNSQSWWTAQRPYRDPKVNRLATHTASPSMPNCGPEALNLSSQFQPGSTIHFAAYYRDQLVNAVSSYSIRRPDGTIWQSWNHTSPNTYSASWWSWTYSLPLNAPTGTWSFRVTFNNQTTVHNFTVQGPCSSPAFNQISATNLTTNSARLNCSVTGVQAYDWRYRQLGATNWIDVPSTTVSYYNLSGLQANTTYEFQVSVRCSNGAWSNWSPSGQFTTLSSACNTPGGLATTAITSNSATVSWQAVTGAQHYSLQLLVNGSWQDVIGGPFTGTSRTITGLTSGTTYQWRIRSNCSSGQSSAWSSGVSFTTIGGCGMPTGLSTTGITQVKATLSWGAVSGATSYTIQFFYNNTWNSLSPVTGTTANVYGLYANATYQWRVFAKCGSSQGSPSAAITFSTQSAPNCNLGTQYPSVALNPSTSWQYQTLMWGGEYCVVNVQAGQVYTFSYCSSDGGVLSFDGELSIRTMGNQLIMYSDDVCGSQPRLVWQAGFTGQVRVLLTRYTCQTQNTNSAMAYRIGGTPFNDDNPADGLVNGDEGYLMMSVPQEEMADLEDVDKSATRPIIDTDERSLDNPIQSSSLKIRIEPNPASNTTIVTMALPNSEDEHGEAAIALIDMNGSIRRTYHQATMANESMQMVLDLSDLPAGMYVVQVRIGRHVGHAQLVLIQ